MSFIVVPQSDLSSLNEARLREGWKEPPLEFGEYHLAVAPQAVMRSTSLSQVGAFLWAIVGDVWNLAELRTALAPYDPRAIGGSAAELAGIAVGLFGFRAIGMFEGAFAGFRTNLRNGDLICFSDTLGQMPLYRSTGQKPWLAPNPRLFARKPGFRPVFVSEQSGGVIPRADTFCPLSNVVKVKPGWINALSIEGNGVSCVAAEPYHTLLRGEPVKPALEDVLATLRSLLVPSIQSAFDLGSAVGVPLSGGLDSSIVASVGAKTRPISTIALGTEVSDEFEPAAMVAAHIQSSHEQLLLQEEDVLHGFFDAIYFNGIFDGYAAEVQASLFALYRKAAGRIDTFVTGYGADLIFGGIFNSAKTDPGEVNDTLWAQVYRTRWSGEFSPVGAHAFGLGVRHPFWTPRILAYGLNLDASLKVGSEEVKICLRRFAERENILPSATVWRKKIGIHEGSSVNKIVEGTIGSCGNIELARDDFANFLFKGAISGSVDRETFDPYEALDRFRSQAAQAGSGTSQ